MNAFRRRRVQRRIIAHKRAIIFAPIRQIVSAKRLPRIGHIFVPHEFSETGECGYDFIFKHRPPLLAQRRLTSRGN